MFSNETSELESIFINTNFCADLNHVLGSKEV